MTSVRWRWTAVLVYMLFIFLLSSVSSTPNLPGNSDKHLHALLYAGLGAVVIRALANGWRSRVTLAMVSAAVAIAGGYGLSDEFHQSFVPGRQSDLADVAADTAGALIAGVVCYVWSRLQRAGSSAPV